MARATIIATILLVVGTIFLAWFLVRIFRRLTYKEVEGSSRGTVTFIAILVSVVLLACSWFLFWMGHQLKTFRAFTPPGTIGQLEVWKESDNVKSLRLEYYSREGEKLSKPTKFYLTGNAWRLGGQYVRIPGPLKYIFESQHFYKVTDFYGEYVGFRPPGAANLLFPHQTIEGGGVDIFEYAGLVPFVKSAFVVCQFENMPEKTDEHIRYDIVLTDSCEISFVRPDSLHSI